MRSSTYFFVALVLLSSAFAQEAAQTSEKPQRLPTALPQDSAASAAPAPPVAVPSPATAPPAIVPLPPHPATLPPVHVPVPVTAPPPVPPATIDYSPVLPAEPAGPFATFLKFAYAPMSFLKGFVVSFTVIVVSEIGDKTFFIAAIMAMRHPRRVVFIGAAGALALMTILSVALGFATTIIPHFYTHVASIILFFAFGFKLLKDAFLMTDDDAAEELEEAKEELENEEKDVETGGAEERALDKDKNDLSVWFKLMLQSVFGSVVSKIGLQAFTLTFLAEWGDRSQITTIALATREDPLGVSVGGSFGHFLCTGLAVLGGAALAERISVRTVTFIGGATFCLFGFLSLTVDPF
eukprot:gnl/Spiro4/12392_TR6543_c0_g1_i1.p1 gnl/Spiro4/12392_TR6543_c0_g1~~gnl/Spiro4/12392_TR6543_c0_g1_i1.p1  ORF type:complete len:366 (+),score=97.44 gnl/Spiro4/12392_TR6543_c0_g1_i1:44-1099(+)